MMAVLSAVFAGLTAILAKCGIRRTNSDVATALRTIVVLLFAVLMVFVVGSQGMITQISGKSWLFLILSGIATGASWICYFKALSLGDVNKVAPIDKSSTVISVLLAILVFGETHNLAVKLIGTAMIGMGTYLMIEKKRTEKDTAGKGWMLYAIGSAVFAALTSVLAKVGISGVESNLATAVRTAVARFDSTPEIPTLASTEVSAAKTAEPMAYSIQPFPAVSFSVRFFSIIRYVPIPIMAVPISFTARLWVSPNTRIASKTLMTVLDLSMGATLLTSPSDNALK